MPHAPSVAIVGIGGIFPDAPDLSRFWENIRLGKSATRDVPDGRWLIPADSAYSPEVGAPDCVYSKRGCFIDEIPPLSALSGLCLDTVRLEGLDPLFHLLLHAGKRAFDAGVTDTLDRSRVGVIIGNLALPSEKSALLTSRWLGRTFEEKVLGSSLDHPDTTPLNRYVAGLPAGVLAAALGLHGGSSTLDAACASSLYAIKLASDELLSGRADAMLAGGLSRPDPLYTQMGFSQLRALSRRGICSPFDAEGDGLVVGEGAGIFLLKRTEDAVAQGDRILGVIRAIGLSNDVGGSLLAPMSEGQLRAMRSAYRKAGWNPQDADLIECHATGTQVGDATEVASLKELWGSAPVTREACVIGSVKSNIGHLLTCAGAAALTKVLLAMAEETLPPTAGFNVPQKGFALEQSPFRVLKEARPWPRRGDGVPRRAAVSAFGFGGINAHLLVEEYLPPRQAQPSQGTAVSEDVCDAPAVASKDPSSPAIAVVGMDARFGPWHSLPQFQKRVLGGDDDGKPAAPAAWWGAQKSAWFAKERLNATPFAGFYLRECSVEGDSFRIPPKEMEEMLPQQLLMLQCAAAAMADAGLYRDGNESAGVFVGIALDLNSTNFSYRWAIKEKAALWARELGLDLDHEELSLWIESLREACGPALTANRTMGALGSVVASRIAREFRFGGPSFTLSCEENSGVRALETAVRQLQDGEISHALVGAVDLPGDLRAALGEHLTRPFSPTGKSVPFDECADGSIIGEGATAVVLKRLEDATAAGDRIYAVIKGIGTSGGTPVLPGEETYLRALERAYGEAGIQPESVSLIEAHGSGLPAADRMEAAALEAFFAPRAATVLSAQQPANKTRAGGKVAAPSVPRRLAVASVQERIGNCGAASGLASFVRGCLALYHEIIPGNLDAENPIAALNDAGPLYLPRKPRYWLRNRVEGPRRAGVSAVSVDGNCAHVVLEGVEPPPERFHTERMAPLGEGRDVLLTITGADREELHNRLDLLRKSLTDIPVTDFSAIARSWQLTEQPRQAKTLAAALVARTPEEALSLIQLAKQRIDQGSGESDAPAHPTLRDRLFYTVRPLGQKAKIGFVFPGSGNHFPGMGMELSARWPEVFRRQDTENFHLRDQFQPEHFWNGAPSELVDDNHLAVIFGQVAAGCATSDLVRSFGVNPQAVIGYSLGESAALFSQRAWRDRDLMLARMRASTLFTRDLAGECRAAQACWGERPGKSVNWSIGVVDAPARQVRRALKKIPRVYLLIVNTPDECVIGGDVKWVKHLVALLGCNFFALKGVTTVHCEVAREVAEPYRELHLFPTFPIKGVAFYSGAKGASYEVTRHNCADAILAQAVDGIDFPGVIEKAYDDGVRCFLEMGPGASCSRMIGRILGSKPHLARSAAPATGEPHSAFLKFLAHLISERIPVDLQPLLAQGREQIAPPSAQKSGKLVVRIPVGGEPFTPSRPATPGGAKGTVPLAPDAPAAASATVSDKAPAAVELPAFAPIEIDSQAESWFVPEDNDPAVEVTAAAIVNHRAPLTPDQSASGLAGSFSPEPGSVPAPNGLVSAPIAQAAAVAGDADPLIREFAAVQDARLKAHETYLRVSENLTRSLADALSLKISIEQQLIAKGTPLPQEDDASPPYSASAAADSPSKLSDEASVAAKAFGGEAAPPPLFDRQMCLEFAIGSVGRMLGPSFAKADGFPTRVRLPDEPLMLVDRIVTLEGEPKSMMSGRVVTEHDIHPSAWYLDGGRIPTCIAVEAGQADLFLSGYLGIDFITQGLSVYRLLDAVVTFHRELPGPGETIHYDIRIERFFRQGETYLFRFHFEATVNGAPLLTMRDGCAGFFSERELAAGKGIVKGGLDLLPKTGVRPSDWEELVPMTREALDEGQLARLRAGDLAGCFGAPFKRINLVLPLTIPDDKMRLVHRVTDLVPDGGSYQMGFIRAEADIHPDDWFLTCHFVDDRVMPGTLMYECCLHTLRIFLMRMGWVAESDEAVWQPVPGVASRLSCRGQVLETTQVVTYEVNVRELGYRPEPFAIVDALMYADGKPIVEIGNMSVRLCGTNREKLLALWRNSAPRISPASLTGKTALYSKEQILAYSNGKPSEGFGDRYLVFDEKRKIARLPGPPFQFMDRVTKVKGEPWEMVAGALVESEYDVPFDAWYFGAERQGRMPFSVLLEVALQPCGWLAAYVGSALTASEDVSFRNLGGNAIQHRPIRPDAGTLTATAALKKVANSAGMIIQEYDFTVCDRNGTVYEGETMFGFFTPTALANQIGIRDFIPYQPTAEEIRCGSSSPYPLDAPFPDAMLRMIDRVELFVRDGGPKGLGYLRGVKDVNPGEWFFKAHFYQDPVTPGSLGLESFLQLVKLAAVERWGWHNGEVLAAVAPGVRHRWLYRGQVVPTNAKVTVEAWITAADDEKGILTAEGFLAVDGRAIYRMEEFTVQLSPETLP